MVHNEDISDLYYNLYKWCINVIDFMNYELNSEPPLKNYGNSPDRQDDK